MEHSGTLVCASIGRGYKEDFYMLLQSYTAGILLRYGKWTLQSERASEEGRREEAGPSIRYFQLAECIQWLQKWKQNPLHAQSSALR